jgi:hypothetical protein
MFDLHNIELAVDVVGVAPNLRFLALIGREEEELEVLFGQNSVCHPLPMLLGALGRGIGW